MKETIIIGAGAAGLACAAVLSRSGKPYRLIERSSDVGSSWRGHYDRLHLHTPKKYSELPFLSYPESYPRYPSRDQVVAYLERYQEKFDIQVQYNTEVQQVQFEDGLWQLQTNQGVLEASQLIIATGNNRIPNLVVKRGQKSFPGTIIHSAEYKNGLPYQGQKVLVVGFGNSACEIAICLHEHGAQPAMSVRSGVNIVPKEIFGIPSFGLGVASGLLPAKWADKVAAPVIRYLVGDIEKLGLKKLPYGPKEQISKYRSNPLLDLGTVDLIKKGDIKIFGDILEIDGSTIHFEEDKVEDFDHIVYATGYHSGLERLLPVSKDRILDGQKAIQERKRLGENGLYFCGFHVSAGGNLREMGKEAVVIGQHIAEHQFQNRRSLSIQQANSSKLRSFR